MCLFTFEARPTPDQPVPDLARAAVAYINAWINQPDLARGEAQARRFVTNAHWEILRVETALLVTRSSLLKSGSKGLEYFEQTLIDDEVMVVYWTRDNSKE